MFRISVYFFGVVCLTLKWLDRIAKHFLSIWNVHFHFLKKRMYVHEMFVFDLVKVIFPLLPKNIFFPLPIQVREHYSQLSHVGRSGSLLVEQHPFDIRAAILRTLYLRMTRRKKLFAIKSIRTNTGQTEGMKRALF